MFFFASSVFVCQKRCVLNEVFLVIFTPSHFFVTRLLDSMCVYITKFCTRS